MAKQKYNTYAQIGGVANPIRLAFPHLFEPYAMEEGDTPKYSACLIIDKNDSATIAKINQIVEEAKRKGLVKKWGGELPGELMLPLRDGDTERKGDEYNGKYFVNVSANLDHRPGVVNQLARKITDEKEVYAGCYVRVSVNAFPYANRGNNGISLGLGNVQKIKDGEPLGGPLTAEDEFEPLSAEELEALNAEQNLDDIM